MHLACTRRSVLSWSTCTVNGSHIHQAKVANSNANRFGITNVRRLCFSAEIISKVEVHSTVRYGPLVPPEVVFSRIEFSAVVGIVLIGTLVGS